MNGDQKGMPSMREDVVDDVHHCAQEGCKQQGRGMKSLGTAEEERKWLQIWKEIST